MLKSKKIVIIAGIAIMVVLVSVYVIIHRMHENSEELLKGYFELINNKEYEKMYEMISKESKEKISKEDFIARNKNIYSSIDLENIQINIKSKEKNENMEKINYDMQISLASGEISFENSITLKKQGKEGYKINWSSNIIFPNLNDNDDKVKVKKIESTRGEIQDRNGVTLAGQGQISSVRNRSRKTWRE